MERKKKFLNCRGNAVFDVIVFLTFVFIIIISAFAGKYVFSEINTDLQADDLLGNTSKTLLDEQNSGYGSFLDWVIVFLVIGLWFVLLVTAWLIDSNPIFFVITLIIMIAVFIMSMFLGNIYTDIAEDSDFSSVVSDFQMTHFIMDNILIFAIAIAFSIMLVLFGKNQLG